MKKSEQNLRDLVKHQADQTSLTNIDNIGVPRGGKGKKENFGRGQIFPN